MYYSHSHKCTVPNGLRKTRGGPNPSPVLKEISIVKHERHEVKEMQTIKVF